MPSLSFINGVFLTVGGALLVAAGVKSRRLDWDPQARSQVALCGVFAALGVSFVAQAPVARDLQAELFPQLGQLTGNGLTLVAAFGMQVMVLHILHTPEEARGKVAPRLAAQVVALIAAATLFLTHPVEIGDFSTPDVGPDGFTAPPLGILAYYVVYLTYLVLALVDMMILIGRYARRARDGYLRTGLRLFAAGCFVGLVYAAGRIFILVVGQFGIDFSFLEFLVGVVTPSVAVLLMVVGATFGRWAPLTARPVRWLKHRRSYRRLAPLWEAARQAQPGLVLDTSFMRVGLRLYRRIIEIQDAQLLIGAHLDPSVRARARTAVEAAGLVGAEAEATVDAAVFAVGVRVLSQDEDAVLTPVAEPPSLVTSPDDDDLAGTAQRLERMSAVFQRSPIVQRFAQDPSGAVSSP